MENPKTKEEIFEALDKKGVKIVRIPIFWSNHLIDNNYTIDPKWMKRVKQVVDWALKKDLFIILNLDHYHA